MQTLKKLYHEIINLSDLKPSPRVNSLFSDLVTKALGVDVPAELSAEQLNTLQLKCSEAEYELELFWNNLILESDTPQVTITHFPYWQNYLDLTKMEWLSLQSCTNHTQHNVLFLGGGPLPLTAIVLAMKYKVKSVVLEKELVAVEKSRQLIQALQLEDFITIIHSSAEDFSNYKKFNVIFIAALVGGSIEEKLVVAELIKSQTNPGTHILARSSWGGRRLLYKPISEEVVRTFTPVLEVHPHNDVVNSVIIMERK